MAVAAPTRPRKARRTTAEGRRSFFGAVPATAFLALLFLGPIVILAVYSIGLRGFDAVPGLEFYRMAITDEFFRSVLLSTLRLSAMVTLWCLVLGYPIAWIIVNRRGVKRTVMIALLIAPLLTNQVVRTFGWVILLSDQGILNSLTRAIHPSLSVQYLGNHRGVVIALVHIFLPFMILPLLNTLENMPPSYREAAMANGAHPVVGFARIIFPLSLPGIIAGGTLTFLLSASALVTPLILGQNRVWVVTTFIWQQIQITQWGRAAAMAMILCATAVLAIVASQVMQQRMLGAKTLRKRKRRPLSRLFEPVYAALRRLPEPGRWMARARSVYVVAFFAFMMIPLLVVVKTAFDPAPRMYTGLSGFTMQWFSEAVASADYRSSFFLSLRIAVGAVVLGLALGVPAAYAVVKGSFPGRNAVLTFLLSPLTIPGMVIGLGLILFFQEIGVAASFWRLLLVHVVLIFGHMVRILSGGFESFDPRWEESAVTLGARRWTVFRRILLPTMRPALFAAAVFGLLISFDEVTVTVLVGGWRNITLPVRMFGELSVDWTPVVAAVSAMLIAFAVVVLFVLQRYIGLQAYRTVDKR